MKEKRMVTKDELNELKETHYTNSSIGVYKDSEQNWNLIEIKFNPENGHISKPTIHAKEINRDMIIEKFKLLAVELGLVG